MLRLSFVGNAGKDIEKACQGIYPLQNTFVRKVKVLRSPKFDVTKLMEVHGDYTEEVGAVGSGSGWTCSVCQACCTCAHWCAGIALAGVLVTDKQCLVLI